VGRRTDIRSDQIARARWQLWATTFLILGSLAVVLVFVSSDVGGGATLPVPRSTLRVSLIGLIVGFVLYAVDRERNLRRLAERLTRQEIESARLAGELEVMAELKRERDTNAALLDGSADGVAVVDSDLRLVRFNTAMADLCGLSPDALGSYAPAVLRFASPAGEPLVDGHHPLAVAVADAAPSTLDVRMRVDDAERWVSGTFSPIRDGESGRVALVLVTARDVTSRKETEAMQRDFVSIVSHELRTPLTAIKGFAKTLLQRDATLAADARREYLTTVNEQADRLARLVEDLLQVSRIDAKRLKIERDQIDLGVMVKDLANQFGEKWAGREILVEGDGAAPAYADRRKIEEVLINLIDNAVKYSTAPEPVTVRIRSGVDEIECTVEDHGFGIAPEDAKNLFQRFQRVSTPETRDIGGTGLGLYIVKGLIEAHGGHVWVDSVPGSGSTFGFTLPVDHAGGEAAERVPAVGGA